VANVYIDNNRHDEAARQLLAVGADIVVVVKSTPPFRKAFDLAGGALQYPHRTFDVDDDSDCDRVTRRRSTGRDVHEGTAN
jgi:hypothetical protein